MTRIVFNSMTDHNIISPWLLQTLCFSRFNHLNYNQWVTKPKPKLKPKNFIHYMISGIQLLEFHHLWVIPRIHIQMAFLASQLNDLYPKQIELKRAIFIFSLSPIKYVNLMYRIDVWLTSSHLTWHPNLV